MLRGRKKGNIGSVLDGADLCPSSIGQNSSVILAKSSMSPQVSSTTIYVPSEAQKQSDAIIDTQCLSSRFSEIE